MATLATLTSGLNHDGRPVTTPVGSEVAVEEYTYSLAAALADDDVIEAIWLPAGHVLVAPVIALRSDEVDTDASPALTLNVGAYVDGTLDEDNIIDGMTTGAAGNFQVGPSGTTAAFDAIGYSEEDRKIVITVDGAPATGATEGDITLTVGYRAATQYDTLSDT